jgi:tight adherence protein B
MDSFYPILIFIVVLVLIELGYLALKPIRFPEKREVRKRLKALSVQSETDDNVDILRKNQLSKILLLHRLLRRFPIMEKVSRLVEQSGVKHPPGFYILLSPALSLVGLLGGLEFHFAYFPLLPSYFVTIPWASGLAVLPFLYLRYKRRKRFLKFEEQLPEALDLISRSLKAGHAFSSGMRLVSEEMDNPASGEFEKTLNEINFGVSTHDALINLTKRVPLDDLMFFVISVILQRETGGNLAEILENLARLIRERFKLNGHVRVLSAQARLSAYILVAIPIILGFAIHFINPEFFEAFFEHPSGKYVLAFGGVWLIVGIFAMKRLVTIRV